MKALRLFLPLAAVLVALFALRSRFDSNADVVCRGTALGLECAVTNQRSAGTLNVFWDVRLQCRNGAVIRASASQRVPRNDKFVHLIPLSELKGLDQCDAGQSLTVENVITRNSR
jgi:hypothetical protein